MDLFQLLSSQDVNWWTGVVWITCGLLWCFYQLFGLSFWRHPFTAEHPLLRHWCSATFLQIWWRNKVIYVLYDLRVITFSANYHFWVNYAFKVTGSQLNKQSSIVPYDHISCVFTSARLLQRQKMFVFIMFQQNAITSEKSFHCSWRQKLRSNLISVNAIKVASIKSNNDIFHKESLDWDK